jgi:hypothetical protein
VKQVTPFNNLARHQNCRWGCRKAVRDPRNLPEKLVEPGAAEPTLQSKLE